MSETMNKYISEWYENNNQKVYELMRDIWAHPELGLNTYYACEATAEFIKKEGFSVECKCAEDFDNPNAKANTVIARWGQGSPVIGIIGELDALPGLGNEAVPYRAPIEGAGHGCGHNVMGGGACSGAAALKYAMEKEGLQGTVVLIETPAEETGVGKAHLAKDGVFKELDMALMWHPGAGQMSFVPLQGTIAFSALFEFFGKTAHASAAPWNGRSGVDAVLLMNMGCEFLREHTPKNTQMHFCITDGGSAPNVVPDHGATRYMFRSEHDYPACEDVFLRAIDVAKGAALMTGTEMKYTIESVIPQFYLNLPLYKHVYEASLKVPKVVYTDEEYKLAADLYTIINPDKDIPENKELLLATENVPFDGTVSPYCAATDAADMSYYCPTVHIWGGGKVVGCAGHHWQTTFCAGSSFTQKFGMYAYSILAQAGYDAIKNPEIVKECWEAHKAMNIPEHKNWI